PIPLFFYPPAHHRDLHSFPHDALPISFPARRAREMSLPITCSWATRRAGSVCTVTGAPGSMMSWSRTTRLWGMAVRAFPTIVLRSEEHTSELQSRGHLVCRLLLEKKKQ